MPKNAWVWTGPPRPEAPDPRRAETRRDAALPRKALPAAREAEEETAKDIFAALVELVRREVPPSVGGSRGTIAKTHERHRKNDQVARLANQQKT